MVETTLPDGLETSGRRGITNFGIWHFKRNGNDHISLKVKEEKKDIYIYFCEAENLFLT